MKDNYDTMFVLEQIDRMLDGMLCDYSNGCTKEDLYNDITSTIAYFRKMKATNINQEEALNGRPNDKI